MLDPHRIDGRQQLHAVAVYARDDQRRAGLRERLVQEPGEGVGIGSTLGLSGFAVEGDAGFTGVSGWKF